MGAIPALRLHHVSLLVTDLETSVAFYGEVFGFTRLARPPFKSTGAWLATAHREVHLIEREAGTPAPTPRPALPNDIHFAVSTDDFEGFLQHARTLGFSEDRSEDDPRRMLIRRAGPASFPQVFLLDPDFNIIEVNAAP